MNIELMKRDFSICVTPTNFGHPETSWIIGSDIVPVILVDDEDYRIHLVVQGDTLILVMEDRKGQDNTITIHPLPPAIAEVVRRMIKE